MIYHKRLIHAANIVRNALANGIYCPDGLFKILQDRRKEHRLNDADIRAIILREKNR